MSKEQININVIVADRPYRLKIKPEEEEFVRKAAKSLNEKVKEFRQKYEGKDKQDYVAMAALMFAVDFLNVDKSNQDNDEEVQKELDDLAKLLDSHL